MKNCIGTLIIPFIKSPSLLSVSLAHQVPGSPLGDCLRANVGRESRAVGVRPVPLVEGPDGGTFAEPDRRDRGGDDDPLHTCVQARAQDPEGSRARGHDQLVRVLRLLGREW